MDINAPGVPEAVREHGKIFRMPARFVVGVGNNEFLISSDEGELLDVVCLK